MSLYTRVIRPILFIFPAESVRNFLLALLRIVGGTLLGEWLLGKLYSFRHPSLEKEVFGVRFRNPIGAAAGLDRDARIYRQLGSIGFGFVEIGSVTPKPQQGDIRPRLFRLPGKRAIIHRMGQPNCGIEQVIEHIRRRAHGRKVVVGANIAPSTHFARENTTREYLRTFRNLYQYVEYFTVNVNALIPPSENYSEADRALVEEMLEALFDFRRGQNDYRPILLKISPDWSYEQIDDMVKILIDTPLDGLVVSDSSANPGNILTPKQQSRMTGGSLSGAPLLERTIELVRYVCSKMDYSYPVIGVGGVMSAKDAQRLLDAGASLVQCYSALVYEGPAFPGRVCRQMAAPAIAQERAQKRAK
jgi:dihydroorotate dehydrogenase